MLNICYSKLSKLLFVVLLVMVCIIGFTKNTSYAITYEEFYTIMENNVGNSNQNIINWWSGIKGQNTTITGLESKWKSNNSIAIMSDYNNTYGWRGVIYFIHNSGSVYRNSYGIKWTEGRNGWDSLNFSKSWVTEGSNNHNIDNFVPSYADILDYGNIFDNVNSSWVFITDSDIYSNSTITELTPETWYFKTYSLTSTNFEKYQSNLDYSDYYTFLGKITGEDLNVWRTRAILYQNGGIIASYGEIGLGGNNENGMTARKSNNLDDDDIYIYVRTSLLYLNKVYSLDVYYDEDESILEFNESYNFSIGSGDSGYTSQNSTNDIIQNQNQNNQELIETITNSGDFNGVMIGNLGLSGDITSGDTNTIAGQLGYVERANPWQDFINRMLYDIGDVLMNNEDVDYTLGFHNTTSLTLHSRDFVLPDGPIKVFLNICLTYFIVVILYQEMKKIVNKINEGDYIYALNRGDAIEYFYM